MQVVAAIKAIRMVNVMENSNGPDKNSTVSSFMQSLNKSERLEQGDIFVTQYIVMLSCMHPS